MRPLLYLHIVIFDEHKTCGLQADNKTLWSDIMKMGETPNTYNSVVSYQADANFATRVINLPTLADEVQPGSVIKSDGSAYTSGSDALLVLSHHRASEDANIIVADRGVYIRPETVIAVMGETVGAAAIAALTANGNIRVALADK